MATAKFKISDLTDNITSADLLGTPANYDFIINDLSSGTAETKKIGLDTLKTGLFGSATSPSGDIVINGNLFVTNPDGPDLGADMPDAGVIKAYDFMVDTADYSNVPVYDPSDRENGFPPGFTFSGGDAGSGLGDGASDTGIFWDGDDRCYMNTGNRPGLLVARRKRPSSGVNGDLIEVLRNSESYDPGGNHVGINVVDPMEKLHVVGNLRVDNDTIFDDGNFTEKTGVILAREFFVNVSDFTSAPNPGGTPGTFIPGYSFSVRPDGDGTGRPDNEGGNDTGMFWDGDDRVYLNAGNLQGLVVATRERATTGTQGDNLSDPKEARVGIGPDAANPRSRLHVGGDTRIEGNIILKSPNGNYWNITVDNSGTISATAAGNLESGTADAAYQAEVDAKGVYYDESLGGSGF